MISYKTSMLPANQVGRMVVSSQVCVCIFQTFGFALLEVHIALLLRGSRDSAQVEWSLLSQVQGFDLAVLLGAFLAFQEWDGRRR